jgi:hypothetical protein
MLNVNPLLLLLYFLIEVVNLHPVMKLNFANNKSYYIEG